MNEELIEAHVEDYGFDNPTLNLNNIQTSVIFVQSKPHEDAFSELSQDPFAVKENSEIKHMEIHNQEDEDSSSDSIEVVHLDESFLKPSQRKKFQFQENESEKHNKEEKSKASKRITKKEFDRKKSINVFEEQHSFWDIIENPQSHFNIIDPRKNLLRFLFTPPPEDVVVKCQLNKTNKRDKTMLFTKFIFSLQISDRDENERRDLFTLMAARCRKKSKMINYLISTDASEMKSNSSALIGKMKGNFMGTKFRFYRLKRPFSPNLAREDDNGDSESDSEVGSNSGHAKNIHFDKLGIALYRATSLIKQRPREIDTAIPKWDDKNNSYMTDVVLPNDRNELFNDLNDPSTTYILNNIHPNFNEDLKCFTLDFGGRAKKTSVKNFALGMKVDDKNKRVYHFGKCKDHFIIDYAYPLCAFQAFALGLSSCHRKFASD